ncbi:hypothetical protein [Plasticicumulans sp.]|uniref:hypothetical protein n=1 Tax=Plasticicumulans sp. TaxID=2307179 RepID=UPI00395F69B1
MADEPIRIHIPVTWDYDRITDACAKLAELTGRDFEAEMLAAAGSGELPANGWYGIQDDPAGNLENARHHGARAAVCWDAVAEWLQTKGYDARRGRWIEFDKALEQLQARIAPAPTAAELESWIGLCGLKAYVDARSDQRYLFDSFLYLRIAELPERRLHLWLDSEEVAAFEPPCRWLTLPQLCERWQVDESKVQARLKQAPWVISWPLPFDDNRYPFECVITLESVRAIESENPAWLKFDAFNPDRQLFPWLDLRDRDKHDAQRHAELLHADPAGELGRLRAAAALGLQRLSCWLEPDRIAALYGDTLVAALVERAVFAGLLPARRVCTGVAVHVNDFAHWPGIPPIPDGAAGELARAWLSMASAPDDSGTGNPLELPDACQAETTPVIQPAAPDDTPDCVLVATSDSAGQGMPQSFTEPEPTIQPEPRTELPNPGAGKRTRIIGIKRAVWTACDVLLKHNPNCRPSAQDVIEYWNKPGDSEGVVRDIGMDGNSGLPCAYWTDSRGRDQTATLRALGKHIDSYLRERG